MHPKRWCDWCVSKHKVKEIDSKFIEQLKKCALVVYNIKVLKNFIEECAGAMQLGVIGTFFLKNVHEKLV